MTDFRNPITNQIIAAIAQGQGIEASILGQIFDVYRNGQLYLHDVSCLIQRTDARKTLEIASSLRNIIFMTLTMDFTLVEPGDVLINVSNPLDRFVVCTKRPPQNMMYGFRAEIPCYLRRPRPALRAPGPDNYIDPISEITHDSVHWLTRDSLTGVYSWNEPPILSSEVLLYASKSQVMYSGQATPFKLPTDTRTTRWIFALENLSGITIEEGDQFVMNGDFYEVYSVDIHIAGFSGQLVSADLVKP